MLLRLFDFYLPELNTCIEFNGLQHYTPITYFGGENEFNKLKIRDEIKKKGIVMITISL